MKVVPFLRVFFIVVLVSMLSVTIWASMQGALWKVPREVATHPWFIATLFDAYWGFLTFYCWVFYLERSLPARMLWLVAILLLGNIAMAVYALIRLIRLPADATMETLLMKRA
ncbi:DUF1475 family protein [Verrucomicrobium sp. BvORR034]|uniref:DUF1475 family protein n=1 Tax=Verrucomicrobium sp. BvORR034 TaxID=1396418 RepID=UPI0006791E4B|nr:DUF1475 family protein [Verrucomicrobium sp. BvORR034]